MKLNFSIDTEDLYGENGIDFENLFSDSMKREIIKNTKGEVASDEFKKFSLLVSDTIIAETKLRMENFLREEIALSGRYGEKMFVGSVEDLIKQRFDDVLLRPVDNNGKTLQGCTSSGKTWIEWSIEQYLGDTLKRHIKSASDGLQNEIKKSVTSQLSGITSKYINEQVGTALANVFSKG